MFAGYLQKRNAPISPPSMQRVYCVLMGTMLSDYESEEDAKASLSPKLVVEILGVSEWDGKGRVNSYPGGFLLVTHTGSTYYVTVSSLQERDEWMLHLRRGLECVFANPSVSPYKPSKIIQNRPANVNNAVCPRTGSAVYAYSPLCKCCMRSFYSNDHLGESAVLLQLGYEESERVCLECKRAQLIVHFLKTLNYLHAMDLHEFTPSVLRDVDKFKASFKLRRRLSPRLDMAAELLEAGNLTVTEFEELRDVDHCYRREMVHEEKEKLRHALETFKEDMQTLINVLSDGSVYCKAGRVVYFVIVVRILEIADYAPDLVDFYFPQLFAVFLQQASTISYEHLVRVDALQQLFLALSLKYPALGVKLALHLLAALQDYEEREKEKEKKLQPSQYAACASLLLQWELVTTGSISCIADVPLSLSLAKALRPAGHQMQEIASEVSVLFLARRRLQEAQDEEELARLRRALTLYGPAHSDLEGVPLRTDAQGHQCIDVRRLRRMREERDCHAHPETHSDADTDTDAHALCLPGANTARSCVSLLRELCVKERDRESESDQKRNAVRLGSSKANGGDSVHEKRENDGSKESTRDHAVEEEDSEGDSDSEGARDCSHSHSTHDALSQWDGAGAQLDFLDRLNAVVDALRFVDRAARTETLRRELTKWNAQSERERERHRERLSTAETETETEKDKNDSEEDSLALSLSQSVSVSRTPSLSLSSSSRKSIAQNAERERERERERQSAVLGWDPVSVAGEPLYRIVRVVCEECRVFRTKARAPSMLVCEVMRDDVYRQIYSRPRTHTDTHIDTHSEPPHTDSHAHAHSHSHHHAENVVNAACVTRAVVHSVVRARAESFSQPASSHVNGNHATDSANDSVSQSIRDVDSLLLDGSVQREMREREREREKEKERERDRDAHTDTHTPPNSAKESLSLSVSFANAEALKEGETPVRKSASARERRASTHALTETERERERERTTPPLSLPRWRRNASLLPANRLSASTEGILRSSHSHTHSNGAHSARAQLSPVTHTRTHTHSESPVHTPTQIESSPSSPSPLHTKRETNTFSPPALNRCASSPAIGRTHTQTQRSPSHSQDIHADVHAQPQTLTQAQEGVEQRARRLLREGLIDEQEYSLLVRSDRTFREQTERERERERAAARERERQRVESTLGESFARKRERLLAQTRTQRELAHFLGTSSPAPPRRRGSGGEGALDAVVEAEVESEVSTVCGEVEGEEVWPVCDLRAFIVKTNDDLRQEVCVLQLMRVCKEVFAHFGLADALHLRPYRIACTGSSSGVVEVLADALSLDALKRTPGFTNLSNYFLQTYGPSKERIATAKRNFMRSLAAYSLFCYLLQIKDRHNGNILLDREGYILHIDFGFVLSIAPGGSFSIETAPFKLTDEMVDLLGGLDSPLFGDFVTAFTKGFIALQANCENLLAALSALCAPGSACSFPCFQGRSAAQIMDRLRARFRAELSVNDAVKHCLDLITNSYGHYGTRQYDTFQYYTNGILP